MYITSQCSSKKNQTRKKLSYVQSFFKKLKNHVKHRYQISYLDGVVVRGRDEKGALGAGDGERLVADEVRGRILVLDSSVHADLTKGTTSQPKHRLTNGMVGPIWQHACAQALCSHAGDPGRETQNLFKIFDWSPPIRLFWLSICHFALCLMDGVK